MTFKQWLRHRLDKYLFIDLDKRDELEELYRSLKD